MNAFADPLVSPAWLSERLGDPSVVVLDCSVQINVVPDGGMQPESGRAAFDAAHIPTARFADLIDDLSDTTQPIGFAIPTPQAFCDAMGALGVGDESTVVVYDTGGNMWAARVWWMLRWVGFNRVALLDGGLSAWERFGGVITDSNTPVAPATLTARPQPKMIADKHEVLSLIDDPAAQIVDTLFDAHFRGEVAMYQRAGHISGAVLVSVMELVDEHGCLVPSDEVSARHGGDPTRRTVTYCGGGIAASLNAFALVRAGFTDVAVYAASLQEWAADPDLPMSTSA